jgi:hypothetical protein
MGSLREAIVLGVLGLSSSAVWAAPKLQLYVDPARNSNAIYHRQNKGWETNANPMTLSAFMQGLSANHNYRIIISLPARPSDDDPNGRVKVTVTDAAGNQLISPDDGWVFGSPNLPPGDHAQSELFPAWFMSFDFRYAMTEGFQVFDVRTKEGEESGYRKDFILLFGGAQGDTRYHFDLLDLDTGEYAPLTHDAQRNRKRSAAVFVPPLALSSGAGGVALLTGSGGSPDPGHDSSPPEVKPPPGSSPGGSSGGSSSPSDQVGGGPSDPLNPPNVLPGGGSSGGDGDSPGGDSSSPGGGGGGDAPPPIPTPSSDGGSVTSPEPSTIALLLVGGVVYLAMLHTRRSRRQKAEGR